MGGHFVDRNPVVAAAEVAEVEAAAAEVADVEVAEAPEVVLVTGAAGFIGSHLVKALATGGRPVRALVLPGETVAHQGASAVVGDVRDRAAMERACQGVGVVFHLAARVGDWGPEQDFQSTNVEGTRTVLEAAAKAGCRRFVMVSSITVYGWQLHTDRCDEDLEHGEGVSAYSRTKSESERLVREFGRGHEMEVVLIRPGNVYGPGESPWVSDLAEYLRQGRVPLIDGGRGDAGLVYVGNVVDALIAAGERARAAGRIYNVVDGHGVTWRQYFSDVAKIVGAKAPRLSVPHRVMFTAARATERIAKFRKSKKRPLLTREAVTLLHPAKACPLPGPWLSSIIFRVPTTSAWRQSPSIYAARTSL